MLYDPSLKEKAQKLALEYFEKKDKQSIKELNKIKEKMIVLLENYVFSYCINFSSNEDLEDFKQSARLGIVSAMDTYKPEKGSFCTWVIWDSRNKVIRNRAKEQIKIPNYVKEKIRQVRFFEHKFLKSNGRYPEEFEILEGIPITKVDYEKTRFFEELSIEDLESAENNKDQKILKSKIDEEENRLFYLDILREVGLMSEVYQGIFNDYFIENNTVADLSKKYGLKQNLVYNILSSIKLNLRNKLENVYFT